MSRKVFQISHLYDLRNSFEVVLYFNYFAFRLIILIKWIFNILYEVIPFH